MRTSLALAVWLIVTPTGALAQTAPAAPSSSREEARAEEGMRAREVRVSTRRAVPENVVTVDLGALLDASVAVLYERAFTPSFSAFVGPRARLASWSYWPGDGSFASEWAADPSPGVEFGVKVYMRGFAPNGAYVSPRVSLHWQSWSVAWWGPREGTHTVVAIEFGYQWVIERGFTLAMGAGAGMTLRNAQEAEAMNFVLPVRIGAGWAF